MKKLFVVFSIGMIVSVVVTTLALPREDNSAQAQTKSKTRTSKPKSKSSKAKKSPFEQAYQASRSPKTKAIDLAARKLQETFVRQAAELAKEYEDAGDLETSKKMLEAILKINDNLKGVREKIKGLDDEILSANEADLELDTSKGWDEPRARVFQGKSFRIQVSGQYKFITNLTVGPEGFPTENPVKEMARGIPCGALMGLVLDSKRKPGRPVRIGASEEVTPEADGLLFLSVNVPPGHKCTGKLKVKLSGYVGKL